jgi:ubiquinone/menaquinone biosynthesis C-methylase UbiE
MQVKVDKGYKGLGMEGKMATWYAKNTAKDMAEFKRLAGELSESLNPKAKILEVAPGPGYLSIELAKVKDLDVTGLDVSHSFVKIASENANKSLGTPLKFVQGNASAMPFADNSFDFIVCRAAFKNFSQPDRAINEMYRTLRPGGKAVIIDLRKDASLRDIDNYIKGIGLGLKDSLIYKLTFRFLLIPRAYTKKEFQDMGDQSKFGSCEIEESGIGFKVTFTKGNK